MVVKTRYMTVRPEDLSGVGKDDKRTIFLVFKSGATRSIIYGEKDFGFEQDYTKLEDGMEKARSVEPRG